MTSSGWPTHSALNASSPSATRSGGGVAAQLARSHPDRVQGMVLCAAAECRSRPRGPTRGRDPDRRCRHRQDRLIPAWRQLELAQSVPGADVHSVDGNHFAFSRYDVFVPVLLEACQTVARRVHDQQTTQ